MELFEQLYAKLQELTPEELHITRLWREEMEMAEAQAESWPSELRSALHALQEDCSTEDVKGEQPVTSEVADHPSDNAQQPGSLDVHMQIPVAAPQSRGFEFAGCWLCAEGIARCPAVALQGLRGKLRNKPAAAVSAHPVLASALVPAGSVWARSRPGSLDVGFAVLQQGFDRAAGEGYLKIIGKDAGFTDEGLEATFQFLDTFTNSPSAASGFTVGYDLRSLQVPPLAMVVRAANWGTDPQRHKLWSELNTSCKLVISPGWRFNVCNVIVATFFSICPPASRTILVTEEDGKEVIGAEFEPPKQEPEAEAKDAADRT